MLVFHHQWVDWHLQPLVLRLPGYIRDTCTVLHHINSVRWTSTHVWAALDVRALYFFIPHSTGLQAIRYHLQHYSTYSHELQEFILLSVKFLLTHNYFLFDGVYYVKRCGALMRQILQKWVCWRSVFCFPLTTPLLNILFGMVVILMTC